MFKSKSKRIIAKVLSFVVCVSCAASVLSGCTRRIEEEPQVSETLPTQPSITTVPTTGAGDNAGYHPSARTGVVGKI